MNNHIKGEKAEKLIQSIVFDSYLKYWCYPNPKDTKGNGNEISDILIVFDSSLFIIEVKDYTFSGNYFKHFRKTTDKAVSQLQGAEKKLFGERVIEFEHPTRANHKFRKNRIKNIQRIIINFGEELKFYSPLLYTKNGNPVHVLDEKDWMDICNHFDTIRDLELYLDSRVILFDSRPSIILPREEFDFSVEDGIQLIKYSDNLSETNTKFTTISGREMDLVANYVFNGNKFPDSITTLTSDGLMWQIDDSWSNFLNNPSYIEKKKKDEISYFIDNYVKTTLLKVPKGEIIGMKLMALSRFDRRILADKAFQFYTMYNEDDTSGSDLFSRGFLKMENVGFAFCYHDTSFDIERINFLTNLVMDSFLSRYEKEIDCLITFVSTKGQPNYNCGYLKYNTPISKEKREDIEYKERTLGWYTNVRETYVSAKEYE